MTEARRTKATIADVARLAGVSKATVSRVLNGSAKVLPDTREAVQSAIAHVGYQESWPAKSLATGRAGAVGVVVTEPFDDVYTDPTFATLLRGIYDRLAQTEVMPILLQASTEQERQKALGLLQRGAADGVIHLTPYVDDGLLQSLAAEPMPIVIMGTVTDPALCGTVSIVFSDDVKGGVLAATHASRQGCTRPLVVMGPEDNPASTSRVEGFRTVFPTIPDEAVIFGGWDPVWGRIAVEDQLRRGASFDVVLAGSDRIALGALDALAAAGVEVPGQVAVIGFDNHPLAETTVPPLTTVEQPLRCEGEAAAELLLDLLAGAPRQSRELEMRLVVRESA